MKFIPLTAEESERARWHVDAYGWIQQLMDGVVTEDAIRTAVAQCPGGYREHFRERLNHYRQKFKAARCSGGAEHRPGWTR